MRTASRGGTAVKQESCCEVSPLPSFTGHAAQGDQRLNNRKAEPNKVQFWTKLYFARRSNLDGRFTFREPA